MTNLTDRPTAKTGSSAKRDMLTRPPEVEKRPTKPLPPPEKHRPYFRWLGWLLAFAVVAIVAVVLYANGTSDTETIPVAESPAVTPVEHGRLPVEIPPVRALEPLPDMPTSQPMPLPGPSLGPWSLETYEMAFVLQNQPTLDVSPLGPAVATPRWTLGPWTLQADELEFILENQPAYTAEPVVSEELAEFSSRGNRRNIVR